MAVTLGMKDILSAKKIRLYLAAGERHRAIFRISVAGEVSVRYPATLMQGHADALILTTEPTLMNPIHPKLMYGRCQPISIAWDRVRVVTELELTLA
ncbi:MAG: hypothetical protein R2748_24270 [Bryobacterales bacterium]